jgi:anti-anti-sigma factor
MANPVLQFELAGPTANPIIRVIGEFDLAGREPFSTVVEQVLPSAKTLTIDMREVQFIDSTGVRALFSAHRRCVEAGMEMLLMESAAVERVFKVLGILNTFNRVMPDGRRLEH